MNVCAPLLVIHEIRCRLHWKKEQTKSHIVNGLIKVEPIGSGDQMVMPAAGLHGFFLHTYMLTS